MPTLLVKNNETGPTVFSDLGENVQIEWQGKGDAAGRDLQRVPDKLMENVDFRRTLDRGILEVVESTPEMEAKIKEQSDANRAQRDARDASIEDVMDRTTDREIVSAEVDEKGKVVTQKNEAREPQPQEAQEAPSSQFSVVQMDESGQPITSEPELQVTIESPQKER